MRRKMRTGYIVFGLSALWLFAPAGCQRDKAKAERQDQVNPVREVEPLNKSEHTAAADDWKKMLEEHKKQKPILVGGCRSSCGDPLGAFRNLAKAMWTKEKRAGLLSFVDTSSLKALSVDHGTGWKEMFKDRELEKRKESISLWLTEFQDRLGLARDAVELEIELESLDMSRRSAREVVIRFSIPDTDTKTGGEVWRFTMGKRGLEWLLCEISNI